MIANDDPAEFLRDHGWLEEDHGAWTRVHQQCLIAICDLAGGKPRSLFEACMVGTMDETMDPVEFPTVAGAVRWVARNTVQSLRGRSGHEVKDWDTR